MAFRSLYLWAAAAATVVHAGKPWPAYTYHSVNFGSTTIRTNQTGATAPGYLYIQGSGTPAVRGPQIIGNDGTLVWRGSDTRSVEVGQNLDVQVVGGDKYLTFWSGDSDPPGGFGYGAVVFLDQAYNVKYNICLAELDIVYQAGFTPSQPCKIDFHESRVTSRGTLLVSVRNITQTDLRAVGGPRDGWVLNSLFMEVDVATGKVVFAWDPLEHLSQLNSLVASLVRLPPGQDGTSIEQAWDFMHLNSVAEVSTGGYVVSSRLLAAAIKVAANGDIEWYLQGINGGNFTLPKSAAFAYQHDVVAYAESASGLSLSMWDNANNARQKHLAVSSGLELLLDTDAMTAQLIHRYIPPGPAGSAPTIANGYYSTHVGSLQRLPGGGTLTCPGGLPAVTEFDADGVLVFSGLFGSPSAGGSYRVYRIDGWVGKPAAKPDAVSAYNASSNATVVYVSWNGATEVARWALRSGSSASGSAQEFDGYFRKDGFETRIAVPGYKPVVQLAAVDAQGARLGTSNLVTTSGGP